MKSSYDLKMTDHKRNVPLSEIEKGLEGVRSPTTKEDILKFITRCDPEKIAQLLREFSEKETEELSNKS